MRLRNKKTGEVVESFKGGSIDLYFYPNEREEKDMVDRKTYQSLAELNEDWEDYVPKEPLIKDEKIRKAVRAWWEAVSDAITDKRVLYKNNQDLAIGVYTIYCGSIYPETLEVGKMYTIDELCGEDEDA